MVAGRLRASPRPESPGKEELLRGPGAFGSRRIGFGGRIDGRVPPRARRTLGGHHGQQSKQQRRPRTLWKLWPGRPSPGPVRGSGERPSGRERMVWRVHARVLLRRPFGVPCCRPGQLQPPRPRLCRSPRHGRAAAGNRELGMADARGLCRGGPRGGPLARVRQAGPLGDLAGLVAEAARARAGAREPAVLALLPAPDAQRPRAPRVPPPPLPRVPRRAQGRKRGAGRRRRWRCSLACLRGVPWSCTGGHPRLAALRGLRHSLLHRVLVAVHLRRRRAGAQRRVVLLPAPQR
uniref:Uncharacterized protein n=1 Tax=Tetraselmis sp. GSL018 TaxID=582737 RepID=A0A061S820_9CHLO